MIDFGPFIDPALLDLVLKGAGLAGIIWIIWLLNGNNRLIREGFSATTHEPVLEAQAAELKRHMALLIAELDACKHEIAVLKRIMSETDDNYDELLKKYISLMKRVDELSSLIADAGGVQKISLPGGMPEVHTGDTVRPQSLPRPTAKSHLAPVQYKALQRNDSTVTKKSPSVKPPALPKKPIPREE